MPKQSKKLALNSGIQTYQILTNNDEVCIQSLSSILLAVCIGVWKQRQQTYILLPGFKGPWLYKYNLRKRFYNFRKKIWISSCYQNSQVRFLGESSRSRKHLLLHNNRLWLLIKFLTTRMTAVFETWKMFLSASLQ